MPDNNLHSITKFQNDIKTLKWLSIFFPKEKRQQIKELVFEHKKLISYELEEIEERALALTKIVALVKWDSNNVIHTEHFEFGCSYQQEDGNVGYPWKNNGTWVLIPWKIQGLYK